MSLVVNTNMASLGAQRNLAANTGSLSKSVQRLSSGLRINSARDDAAGLAVSTKLRAQIASVAVAIRNSQDGISLAQTTEGGLNEVTNILVRMRELSEQSANGTLSNQERSSLAVEYKGLVDEITRITNVTEFNGVKLLNGSKSATGVTLQVGFQSTTNDQITFFSGMAAMNATTLGFTSADIDSSNAAFSNLATIDAAIGSVAQARGELGAVMSRLDSTIANLRVTSENLSSANSAILDADFAAEASNFIRNQILVQAGTSMVAQANMLPQTALTLLG